MQDIEALQRKNIEGGKRQENERNPDMYYLRVEGQKLQDLLKRMDNGTHQLSGKIDEILSNSRRIQTAHPQLSNNSDLK